MSQLAAWMQKTPPPPSSEDSEPAEDVRTWTWLRALLLWLACVAAAAGYGWWIQPSAPDDAMIVLRYARNLVEGHGWVFNVGERVNGSTSAGNTLLLALFGFATGGHWLLAQLIVFALGLGSALFAVLRLFAPFGRTPAVLAAAMCLATPLLGWTCGMETAPVLGCAGLAALSFETRRYRWTGLWLGLLCLARPDGLLLALVILGAFLLRHSRTGDGELRARLPALLTGLAIFVLVLLPWYGFSWLYFGELLPQTLGAKTAQVAAGVFGEPGGVFVRGFHEQAMLVHLHYRPMELQPTIHDLLANQTVREAWPEGLYSSLGLYLLLGSLGSYVLGGVGAIVALLIRHGAVPLIVWGIVHFVVYSLLGVGIYAWYYIPLSFAMTLSVAVLVALIWRRLPGALPRGIAIAIAAGWIFVHFASMDRGEERFSHYGAYLEVARWMDENAEPDATLACCEIGVLGFEMPERPILDMWGLVNAKGATAVQEQRFDWWVDEDPEYVLFHNPPWPHIEASALERREFLDDYEAKGVIVYRKQQLTILRRKF
jgi:arabinofuranosyltransferase